MKRSDKVKRECKHEEAVYWNPYNKVVQCHSCGVVFVPAPKIVYIINRLFKWW